MKSLKNDIKECFTTDSMIQTILSDYENSVTSDWIDSAPTVAEIKHCVEKYIPSVIPSGSCKMESVNWTEMGIIHRNQMVSFQGGDEKNYSPS